MKRTMLWGLAAAAGSALAAPGIYAQLALAPADAAPDHLIVTGAAANPLGEAPADPFGGGPAALPAAATPQAWGVIQQAGGDLAPLAVRVLRGLPAEGADEESVKLMQDNARLSAEIQQLAAGLRDVDDEEKRVQTEEQLNRKVAEQFDVRQRMRERQLAALEEQVRRLRGVHDERGMQRDRIINDRVQQLVREAQGLGWGEVGDGGQPSPFLNTVSIDRFSAEVHPRAAVAAWSGDAPVVETTPER